MPEEQERTMSSHDDPKEIEEAVKRPAINSWTENDPPDEMLKQKPRRKAVAESNSPSKDHRSPGTGRPGPRIKRKSKG
jgi:hypothetical protein